VTVDEKALRALIAEEADKQPLRIQIVRKKLEPGAQFMLSMITIFGFAALLMVGFRAAHNLWPGVPAAGFLDSLGLVLGMSAISFALGPNSRWLR
jgi:hypothetical protein